MSCKECKNKTQIEEMYENTKGVVGFKTITFLGIWTLLGLYGLYELLMNIYELF